MNIKQWLAEASQSLATVSDNPRLDAEVLLAHALNQTRTYLFTWLDKDLDDSVVATAQSMLHERQNGKPIAYITGVREFWSLRLNTNASTLIPRPDTELLVEWSLELLADTPTPKILDLGTGTGAIALALAKEFPNASILGVDVSDDACALAESNRAQHRLENCNIMKSHWFDAIDPNQRFDLIVSNPPYIAETDPHLQQGDVRFEPHSALTSGIDGLSDIRHIANHATKHLSKDGWLLMEHGYNQKDSVARILEAYLYRDICCRNDLGNNPRASLGRNPKT